MRKIGIITESDTRLRKTDQQIFLPGEFGATIEWFVSDTRTGEIFQHQSPKRSESFTKQFLQVLYAYMQVLPAVLGTQVKDTGGITYLMYNTYDLFDASGAVNIDTRGIVVGTGNTAPTITDNALAMKITHGAGAGQLQYGAVTFGAPAADSTTAQFTITRNFANASGSSITVNEIGLYTRQMAHVIYPLMGQYPFDIFIMIIRDVIGGGIAVPNGQTLTVNYRPQAVA